MFGRATITLGMAHILVPSFLRPVLPASRVQHISDMHSKFALRPHHVSKYGRHPVCDGEIRRGKKIEEEERNHRTKI